MSCSRDSQQYPHSFDCAIKSADCYIRMTGLPKAALDILDMRAVSHSDYVSFLQQVRFGKISWRDRKFGSTGRSAGWREYSDSFSSRRPDLYTAVRTARPWSPARPHTPRGRRIGAGRRPDTLREVPNPWLWEPMARRPGRFAGLGTAHAGHDCSKDHLSKVMTRT
jgi:hypothetical protein